ncbi:putative ABC transporter ATP-binding protein YxlF [Clostridium tepidiprofundi DSM 19306]|uniref:Putative ABC transporter ATP-binding protein YxlF n=1 Tax=Clostridium tepidiprofundi DSM 19306 TaxID=1121338 RepID=A0A151B2X8_9CLOT|nr:lantibiotic protection ABC transporter ATP-binding protein [Clostridium tepidiprofundi]KYH34268.1 putative ABC transporter ATP-binding protein YxlF [Clostridium tepidiprofundi DSM 19306]
MREYFLETRNLTKKFRSQIAVNSINLKIEKASIYGFLGPNGAGKSTTLKMITGLLYPSSGEIIIDGHEWSRKDLKYIGALIESPAFYGNLTAVENLKVHAKLLNIPDSRIDEVLYIVDLKDTGNKKAGQFSLGMKQRLGIAIALLNNPKLLILDEPTNGLDPLGIEELRRLIKSLKNIGITIIFSSHILSEVQQVAEYIGIIYKGELRYQNKIDKNEDLEKLFMDIVTK